MDEGKRRILAWLDEERDAIIGLFKALLRERSPNPPGDTRSTPAVVRDFLRRHDADHRVISPHPEMPNIVASFEAPSPGRHLVLNGHLDVFPVPADHAGWTSDPWSAEERDGRIYGRGACDMKAGTTASIITYVMLARLRDALKGKLTLTCVSRPSDLGARAISWSIIPKCMATVC